MRPKAKLRVRAFGRTLCRQFPGYLQITPLQVADIWVIFANFVPLSDVNDGQKLDFQHFGRTYQSPKRGGGAYHCRRELFGRHFGRWL